MIESRTTSEQLHDAKVAAEIKRRQVKLKKEQKSILEKVGKQTGKLLKKIDKL